MLPPYIGTILWNYFEFGPVIQEAIFLIWSSGDHFVQRSGTICAILVEGIMRNNSVNFFGIWASGSGGDVL